VLRCGEFGRRNETGLLDGGPMSTRSHRLSLSRCGVSGALQINSSWRQDGRVDHSVARLLGPTMVADVVTVTCDGGKDCAESRRP
jgi:hypothetical protein